MINEIAVYRVIGIGFMIALPVALLYIIRPARTLRRQRVRWSAVGFVGIGVCFIGLVLSWPGPTVLTSAMMLGWTGNLLSSFLLLYTLFIREKFKLNHRQKKFCISHLAYGDP